MMYIPPQGPNMDWLRYDWGFLVDGRKALPENNVMVEAFEERDVRWFDEVGRTKDILIDRFGKALNHRRGNYRIYGVVQGRNLEFLERSFRALKGYDGWVLEPRSVDELISGMVLSKEYGENLPVHFHEVKDLFHMAFFSRNYGAMVTFTFSEPYRNARKGLMNVPYQATQYVRYRPPTPCQCPACVVSEPVYHNIIQVLRAVRIAESRKEFPEDVFTKAMGFYQAHGMEKYRLWHGTLRYDEHQMKLADFEAVCEVCLKAERMEAMAVCNGCEERIQ